MHRRSLLAITGALLLSGLGAATAVPASAGASHSPIAGSGSSWSSNAVNQWVADVQPNGLQVVFTANGSAVGRKDFANKTTDFAVSDIGFQGNDAISGEADTSQGRGYVYLPIVAGGTAFPYHLQVGGHLVRNLRLSGQTIAKIFTNKITNWNDAAITADNNGRALPSKPIIPVVHSEGSGSSAQLTKYFNDVYPQIWQPFFGKASFTEYYPHNQGGAIAQDGSDGVMNYVASDAADGAIGYDEFSYALGKNYPVVKLENANGYFTQPTQYNVAVGLTAAKINTDSRSPNYLLQDLHDVYRRGDNRAYALSSYSYMIIPTAANDPRMTTAKRQTLADYLYYSICDGQKEMGPIGYSPLPINLAQASFQQINKLKAADPKVDLTKRDISTCGNPTFVAGQPSRNYLAEIAPQPPVCDQVGQGPCTNTGVVIGNPDRNGAPPAAVSTGGGAGGTGAGAGSGGGPGGGSASGGTGAGSASAGGSGPSGATGGTTTSAGGVRGHRSGPVALGATTRAAAGAGQLAAGAGVGTTIDPVTGAAVAAGSAAGSSEVTGVPTELASGRQALTTSFLGPLAIVLLLAAIIAPPLLSRRFAAGPGTR